MPFGLGVFVLQNYRMDVLRMKMKFLIASMVLLALWTMPVSAAEAITKTFEYETKDPKKDFAVSEQIEEANVSYRLQDKTQKVIAQKTPKKEDVQTVDLGAYLTKEAATKNQIEINGVMYELQEISYTNTTLRDRLGSYSHKVTYDDVVKKPDAANTLTVTFTDSVTSLPVETKVALKHVTQSVAWHWVDDLEISVKAKPQDALYFRIGDVLIKNDEALDISNAESEILKSLGLNADHYSLDRAEWNGDQKIAPDGTAYREAVIYGSRYVASFVAEYFADQISLPEADGVHATALYRGEVDDVENTVYTVQVIATYEPITNATAPIVVGTTSVVACGILLFVLFSKRNVLLRQGGKTIYKTKVRKGTVYVPEKIVRRCDPSKDLMMVIKRGYTKRHCGESLEILSDRLPTMDVVIPGKTDYLFIYKKSEI